jgi:hypothetical protein
MPSPASHTCENGANWVQTFSCYNYTNPLFFLLETNDLFYQAIQSEKDRHCPRLAPHPHPGYEAIAIGALNIPVLSAMKLLKEKISIRSFEKSQGKSKRRFLFSAFLRFRWAGITITNAISFNERRLLCLKSFAAYASCDHGHCSCCLWA